MHEGTGHERPSGTPARMENVQKWDSSMMFCKSDSVKDKIDKVVCVLQEHLQGGECAKMGFFNEVL